MHTHPDITRSLANERVADRLRDAELDRIESEGHVSLVSRMRERLARTPARERRVFRPARSAS